MTLHLKRFNNFLNKINRHIKFPNELQLSNFSSEKNEEQINCMYDLFAILIHSGNSCNSGHYYCFVKNSDKMWYCMNDSQVRMVK